MNPLIDPENWAAMASLGAALIFMLVVLAFIWKYTPAFIRALNERSQADVKLATALNGLTLELSSNKAMCQAAQDDFKDTVVEATDRLSRQLDDLKTIAVPTLRGVEAIQTTLQVKGGIANG